MPLEKWVGRFLIDEGERLVKPQGRCGCSTYLTTQETFLLRVAAIRERRGRELIRIGSKGTTSECWERWQ